MAKSLREVIVLRSRLINNFNEKRFDKIWDNFKEQRNFCVKSISNIFFQERSKYEQCNARREQRNSTQGRSNSKHHE